jgi:TRAP-type C4-dicarboxylate transport system substrate-binding protein
MNRRSFIIGAAIASLMTATSSHAQEVTLRLHQFLPQKASIPGAAIEPWIAKIEKESGGRIKIEHFGSMQLGGAPPALYSQAVDGIADIIWTLPGYTPGRFPKIEAFELPFMTGKAEHSSKALHEYVLANAMDEFADTHPLVFHTHGPGYFHTNKALTTLDDVKGQKLRGPTRVVTNMLGKLGATPVGMPVPAVPESVSKGVIDGALIPWEVTLPLKMSELTSHHAGFAEAPGLYSANFIMTMNKAKYESLPDDLKAILDANSGPDVSATFGAAMDALDVQGRKKGEESGNTITDLDAERDQWIEASKDVEIEWIAEMDAKGADGAALVKSARELIAKNTK